MPKPVDLTDSHIEPMRFGVVRVFAICMSNTPRSYSLYLFFVVVGNHYAPLYSPSRATNKSGWREYRAQT
jgi:hypothetical protein